jgi:hypothetical protein
LAQVTILTTTSVNFHRNVERNGQTIDWKMWKKWKIIILYDKCILRFEKDWPQS